MPLPVLYSSEIKDFESKLFSANKIPSILAMENAAQFAFRHIHAQYPSGNALVVCGTGNNGGDGLALARILIDHDYDVKIRIIGKPNSFNGDAAIMHDILINNGIEIEYINSQEQSTKFYNYLENNSPENLTFIVDAIFGIGLNRNLSDLHTLIVDAINSNSAPVISIDIPSGINSADGSIMGSAIIAESTLAFFAAKPGLLFYPGLEYAGHIKVAKIALQSIENTKLEWMQPSDIKHFLPKRKVKSHKGSFGKGLAIGGSIGMSGAITISAYAALRSGIGLLKLAVPESIAPAIWSFLPEAMTFPMPENNTGLSKKSLEQLLPLVDKADCVLFGPGAGREMDIEVLLVELVKQSKKLILDADVLFFLSGKLETLKRAKAEIVITPHIGEMARLLECDTKEVSAHPIECAKKAAELSGAVVLLKDATSVIAHPDGRTSINTLGNPGLAKGGSGDVLAGILLAFLGQGLSLYDAARMASLCLGLAAEKLVLNEKSVLSRDIADSLSDVFNSCMF